MYLFYRFCLPFSHSLLQSAEQPQNIFAESKANEKKNVYYHHADDADASQ